MAEKLSPSLRSNLEIAETVLKFRKKLVKHQARLQVLHALNRAGQAGRDVSKITPDDPVLAEVEKFWQDNAVIIVNTTRPSAYKIACSQARQASKPKPSKLKFCEREVLDIFAGFVEKIRFSDLQGEIHRSEIAIRNLREGRRETVQTLSSRLTKP